MLGQAFSSIVARDLKIAFRRFGELLQPLFFFIIVVTLFPLALPPDSAMLVAIAPAVLWVAALLSSLLTLDGLFRGDAEDGSLEQLLMSPVPLGVTVLAKLAAHWLVSLVPLLLLVPVLALSFALPIAILPLLVLGLLLATPTLTVFVALGAALTVALKRSGAIVGLLVLPLTVPLLLFGTRATDFGMQGEPVAGPLYLLAALGALALSLGPLAIAAALRVSLE